MKTDILMATYNGELYVKSQILSLQSQTFNDWQLIIHDDGSTDNTVEIIKKIAVNDSRINIIEDNVKFGNAGENFIHLLKFSSADFLMFCDQDDIWFDNKIDQQVTAIKKRNNKIPQVLYSNSYVWIPNEGVKGLATLAFPKMMHQFLFLNGGTQGCSAIFNNSMRDLLLSYKGKLAMHDHLLHLLGLCLGELEYLNISLMLYRNHEKNVTGSTSTSTMDVNEILQNNRFPVVDRKHYTAVLGFYETFKSKINKEDKIIIEGYLEMLNQNSFNRLLSVIRFNYQLFGSNLRLMMKILIRPYIN